ncbi:MAG: lytic transglycosylase domain-containing protein [Clostridiales bacterium]|nr:lytic transglycosylase domain-containing protein [Clostridiales bacterium]
MEVNDIKMLIEYLIFSKIYSNPGNSQTFETLLNNFMGKNLSEDSDISQDGNTGGNINEAVEASSRKYGVDADLIKSVIKQESGFNPKAVSKAGALGLMQLMPKTASALGVDNPLDAMENIDAGTRYLKSLIDSYGGDIKLALAAYNGGIGRMRRLNVNSPDKIDAMPSETQNYVSKVYKNYETYKTQELNG